MMNDDKLRGHYRAAKKALLDIYNAKNAWKDLMDAMFLNMAHSAASVEELSTIMDERSDMMKSFGNVTSELNKEQRRMRDKGWWE